MAEKFDEIVEKRSIRSLVELRSIRLVNKYPLPKDRETLAKVMSIAYNTLVYMQYQNYQTITTYLRKSEKAQKLVYNQKEIVFLPPSLKKLGQIQDRQKIFNYLFDSFFARMLTIKAINPERIVELLFFLTREYRQVVQKSGLLLDNLAVLTDEMKKTVHEETWKAMHEDFEYMYEYMSDHNELFHMIVNIFFETVESLHYAQDFIKVNYKELEERLK